MGLFAIAVAIQASPFVKKNHPGWGDGANIKDSTDLNLTIQQIPPNPRVIPRVLAANGLISSIILMILIFSSGNTYRYFFANFPFV